MTAGTTIGWRDWSTEAFQAARRDPRPVLLLVTTAWSAACRRFDRGALADGDVAREIERGFVAIRVDADRRPDIADRYGLGAWPTLVCLTSDGELLSGGSAIDIRRLARTLAELVRTYSSRRAEIEERAHDARLRRRESQAAPIARASGLAVDAEESAARLVREAFDDRWAGFGAGAKTPQVAAVAFALARGARTGDRDLADLAVRTLDRLGWSELSDASSGAFHRACRTRAWTLPDTARLLDVQADLAMLFLDAAAALDEQAYADRARAALDYVSGHLADQAGGFFNSEAELGADLDGLVDRTVVVPANARIVRALLRGAEALRAAHFGDLAMAAIERLVPLAYSPGAGVAHYLVDGSPRVRGLLADQVDTSAALVDLSQASGNRVYVELAEELMRSCRRKLWSRELGGFRDRLPTTSGAGDVGLLADPLVPFAVNCEAARVLARIARDIGHGDLGEMASDVLTALRPARDHVEAADYALAVLEVKG